MKSGWTAGIGLCAGLLASQVFADCVAPRARGEGDFSVCKAWPAYPALTLTAATRYTPIAVPAASDPNGLYDFDVAMVTGDSAEPLATYHRDAAFQSDGIAIGGLTLDTARFALAPDLRAFGVRVDFTNASRLNPMNEQRLSLFIKDGEHLRLVLDQLVVYQYGGEWDGDCEGHRFETVRTLEMAKTGSQGYADLIVKTLATKTTSVGEGEACQSKTSKGKAVLTTLHYDGQHYVIPDALKG